jgi:hypothetical protein
MPAASAGDNPLKFKPPAPPPAPVPGSPAPSPILVVLVLVLVLIASGLLLMLPNPRDVAVLGATPNPAAPAGRLIDWSRRRPRTASCSEGVGPTRPWGAASSLARIAILNLQVHGSGREGWEQVLGSKAHAGLFSRHSYEGVANRF